MERLLHETFGDQRVRKSREFFEVGEDRVAAAMQLTGGRNVTPVDDVVEDVESQAALDSARKRREHFNFEMVGIPPGTKLTFRGDPELVCEVVSQRRVLFEGEEKTLTAAAQALLSQDERYGDWVRRGNVHGTKYWYLDGESVWDRRMRMENEG